MAGTEDDITVCLYLADVETSYKKKGIYLEHIESLEGIIVELDMLLEWGG